MEVHFTPEQEAQVSQFANHNGTNAEEFVRRAALLLIEEDTEFRAAVRRGIAQADAGELLSHDDVKTAIQRLLKR